MNSCKIFDARNCPCGHLSFEVGDVVKKGDVLCIVEAMKVMNEIQSDVAGEIVEALVEDAHSVEYGQTLFKIRKS